MSKAIFLRFVVAGLAVWAGCAGANGQANTDPGRGYRLLKSSEYAEGCFGMCACAVSMHATLKGTMRVTLVNIGDVTDLYNVTNAHFVAGVMDRSFVGSGDYRLAIVSATPPGFEGTLTLTLAQPDGTKYLFTGGPSPEAGGTPYPPIDITIDRNNQICYDQVLHIIAAPMGPDWNLSGAVTVDDVLDFLTDWFAGDPSANYSCSGALGVQDVFDYLQAWFAGRS